MADNIQDKEFTVEELRSELDDLQLGYQKLKFDHAVQGLDNALTLRNYRRDIARVKTELRGRELSNLSAEDLAARSKIRARRRRERKSR